MEQGQLQTRNSDQEGRGWPGNYEATSLPHSISLAFQHSAYTMNISSAFQSGAEEATQHGFYSKCVT